MPYYRYSGKSLNSSEVEGVEKAGDKNDLEKQLLNKGIFLESYQMQISKFKEYYLKIFKRTEVTKFTRQLQVLLDSGIPILEALDLVSEQTKDSSLKEVISDITAKVESGKNLASAFEYYSILFDQMYVSLVDSGELSGNISDAFDRIAEYREKSEETSKKITSALTYPILVVLVAIGVVFALLIYVVPVFSSMYANFGAELPELTQTIVSIAEIVKNTFWYWFVVGFILIVTIISFWFTKSFKKLINRIFLHIPFLRVLIIKIITSRFCMTFGSLLSSGIDILYALDLSIKTTGNYYIMDKMKDSGLQLSQGKTLTQVLENVGYFPKTMIRMTASGEKTGKLGEMLLKTAQYFEKETDSEIKTITTLIEPVIIIFLGVFVAFILIAMYLPLFDLVGTI